MGGSFYSYSQFDSSLTRPLYGHVTELKSGTVPSWVKRPRISEHEVKRLWDLDLDPGSGIPRSKRPDGVRKKSGGRGPTDYRVHRETYLEAHRERIGTADDKGRFRTVRFDLKTSNSTGFGSPRGKTVPSEIMDRLSAIRESPKWDQIVDGYHYSFRRWELIYRLGERGGITDVEIVANIRH